ncbi:MAG: aspartate/glutamate racemase family protein [Chloroflexi bacterium]|nr:aspartate/glutamate racemase family protein [Chloroflexota bacterium]
MKTIGLLGGMSWESTELYYRWINEGVKKRLGGLHSAQIALVSVDFQDIEVMQARGDWDEAGRTLTFAAAQIQAAGADFLVICTNTMHKVAPAITAIIDIPLLHIADATAEHIKAVGLGSVGLLGTSITMEQDFYRGRLSDVHGLNVLIPDDHDRQIIHTVIYEELVLGAVNKESRAAYLRIIDDLVRKGAEGIILGCTEITMLVQQEHTAIPLFDTTALHAQAAVSLALAGD